jgi:glycosyltransferase involved in cell wall biosynthesis
MAVAGTAGAPLSTALVSARPRLLFLSQTLPYPLDSGVAIRTYNVLRLLAGAFDITALFFYRWKGGVVRAHLAESREALSRLAETEIFPIPQEQARTRLAWDHLRSVLANRVYTYYAYESAAFRTCLTQVLARQAFDLVHVDSLDLSSYLGQLPGIPVVCVHHNVESALLKRRGAAEPNVVRRAYLVHQASLMEAEERRWGARVALNVAVSETDAEALRAIAPRSRLTVVPNGVDLDYYRADPGADEGVAYLGGTTWFPNKDALAHFAENILPVLKEGGAPPIRWVGHATPEERSRYGAMGIELTGYLDDVRPVVRDAACFIVPLRIGGGTRLKILDAWAMGKAVVSTSVGCEGLEAVDGENILIRDDPRAFASAVRAVLDDAALRRRLGAAARATVERRYGWEAIGRAMIATYQSLIRPPERASA